jgi:hypothetical protein
LQDSLPDARAFLQRFRVASIGGVLSLPQTRRLLLSTLIAYRFKNPQVQAFPPHSPYRSRKRHRRYAAARLLLADSCYTLFEWPIRFRMLAILCSQLFEGNPMT